jgi:hypothetical protein
MNSWLKFLFGMALVYYMYEMNKYMKEIEEHCDITTQCVYKIAEKLECEA